MITRTLLSLVAVAGLIAADRHDVVARAWACGAAPTGVAKLDRIPTRYVADRWLATPVTTKGDTIVLYLDSGGGGVFVIRSVLDRLGYSPKFQGIEEGDSTFTGGPFPTFRADATIPPPLCATELDGFGTAVDKEGEVGMLGHPWFAGRVWVLDYPKQTMSVYSATPDAIPFGPHTVPMTLKDPQRKNFPRIRVSIAGDSISALLDTGAMSELTDAAMAAMGPGPKIRASAFAAARVWDKWHSAHPEWRVVAGGESVMHGDLIEVPTISFAGYDVGPIWFAKRRNSTYDNMMSPQMDKSVDLSIGGVAFRTFRMTMDYPHQRVTFER